MDKKGRYSITTKKGDTGKTSLLDGSRVDKYSVRPEAYGVMDEANAFLGAYRALTSSERMKSLIISLQNHMYYINSELACPPDKVKLLKKKISENEIVMIENEAAGLEKELQLPRAFVLYGGTAASAYADIARAIIRRAERRITEIEAHETIENEAIIKYMNRLSDLLFLVARYEEKISGVKALHPA